MKEFIEKLIERLEEEKNRTYFVQTANPQMQRRYSHYGQSVFDIAISIVNQLAEEFAPDINAGTNVSEMPTSWIIDGKGIHKQTNADRIRSMTDEELAEFLDNMCLVKTDFHCEECNNPLNCDVCYLDWLQSEAE